MTNAYDDTLRVVGGIDGIKRCLAVGNDAPLYAALKAASDEIKQLRWLLNHQTDEDAWNCRHGKHGTDCGA